MLISLKILCLPRFKSPPMRAKLVQSTSRVMENKFLYLTSMSFAGDSRISWSNPSCHCFLHFSYGPVSRPVPLFPQSSTAAAQPVCHRISESSIGGSCRCNT